MIVELSSKTKKAVLEAMKEYGYKSDKEFIEDALRHRILSLKKAEFLKGTKAVRKKLEEKGLSEKDILRDFDKFYHQK